MGAIFSRAKVVGNFIMEVQITFHIFDLVKLESLRRGLARGARKVEEEEELDEGGGGGGAETTT